MLIQFKEDPKAYQTLGKLPSGRRGNYRPPCGHRIRLLEEKAKPLIPLVKDEIYPKYAGEVWGRYKSWSYPMFIGMALDQARINCGEEIRVRN
jgi:N-sulfoglucosamine sulfohydrolase